VVGLRTDPEGEPLAVRVFSGNSQDVTTVSAQVGILKERFGVQQVVLVGDRGMLKSHGKQALGEVGLRYITALTDPQIRKLLKEGIEGHLPPPNPAKAQTSTPGRRINRTCPKKQLPITRRYRRFLSLVEKQPGKSLHRPAT